MQTEAKAATAATPEQLAQIAANPDALANMTDEQIDALAAMPKPESEVKTEGDTTGSDSPAAAGQTTETATTEVKPDDKPAGTEEAAKVVQGKDGKAIIPYSVLERERERAARAEATAEALAAQIKQIEAGKTTADAADVQLTDEDLQQLEQDLPGVAKAIRSQMAVIEKLTGTVQTLKRGQESTERSAEQVRKDEEEAAIAASETLTALLASVDAKDPKSAARWNRIVDTYESMRDDPEFETLDTAALIGKAEAAVTAIYGPMAVAAKPAASPQETQAALDAKASAALEAAKKPAVPLSSGGIPGGSAPAVDEAAAMLEKSGAQLTAEFMSMTPEQIEAKLARLS